MGKRLRTTGIRVRHVSDVPSFSDHMYIKFRVQSGIKKTKMIRNIGVLVETSMLVVEVVEIKLLK